MSQSPRLKLSYILPQQAQKHVSANESFRRLDALVQLSVKSATLAAEPSAPSEGDAYILPAGAAGASWSLFTAGAVAAFQDGQWLAHAPRAGWRAYVESDAKFHVHDGAAWNAETSGGGSYASLGVNTVADASNRLAVKSDAALFSHDDATPGTGDARVVINKSAAAKTASVVFQDGFAGRAEFGLTGKDDFSLKVSADGASWTEAFVVDNDNGYVGIGAIAPLDALHLVAPSGQGASGLTAEKDDGYLIFNFTGYSSTAIGAAPQFLSRRSRGTKSTPAAVQANDWAGSIAFRGYSPNGAFEQRALIAAIVDGVPGGASVPMSLNFYTGTTGTAERMRVTSGGDVGIGVTAPTAKLDVDGAVKVKSYLKTALPSASASGAGAMVFVSNEIGGAVIAFSDGAAWRRATDRAVVS